MANSLEARIWNTKKGDIVKIYLSCTRIEMSREYGEYTFGVVKKTGKRWVDKLDPEGEQFQYYEHYATVKPLDKVPEKVDRYMEESMVEFTKEHKVWKRKFLKLEKIK